MVEVLRCGLGEMKALALVKTVGKGMLVLSDEFVMYLYVNCCL